MAYCGRDETRFILELGALCVMGREVWMACRAWREIEGDHDGPWTEPDMDAPAAAVRATTAPPPRAGRPAGVIS